MARESPPRGVEQHFSEHLRRVREARGMSQAELARLATAYGVPMRQQTVTRIENGRQSVTLDHAGALAMALGRPLVDMLQPPEDTFTPAELEAALGEALDSEERLRAEVAVAEQEEGRARRIAHDLRARLSAQQERARLLTQRLVDIGGGSYESADLLILPAGAAVAPGGDSAAIVTPGVVERAKEFGAADQAITEAVVQGERRRTRPAEPDES